MTPIAGGFPYDGHLGMVGGYQWYHHLWIHTVKPRVFTEIAWGLTSWEVYERLDLAFMVLVGLRFWGMSGALSGSM